MPKLAYSLEYRALSTELLQVPLQLRRWIAQILVFINTIYIFTCYHTACLAFLECTAKKCEIEAGKNRAGHICNTNTLPKLESLYTGCLIYPHHSAHQSQEGNFRRNLVDGLGTSGLLSEILTNPILTKPIQLKTIFFLLKHDDLHFCMLSKVLTLFLYYHILFSNQSDVPTAAEWHDGWVYAWKWFGDEKTYSSIFSCCDIREAWLHEAQFANSLTSVISNFFSLY